ncbi:MAG: CBS domain-containing protein [Desulfurococcales archaeon]|jgi:CBS domain-containing protein|nr:CBS domain-containing protein [Desulfurococcales archaeon]
MREDIIRYLIDRDLLPRERVSNIMSTPVATIDAEEPVARARITMIRNGISKLSVMKGERPYGIIGMRDLTEKIYYAYFQIGTRRIGFYKIEEKILAVPVKEIVSPPAVSVETDDLVKK